MNSRALIDIATKLFERTDIASAFKGLSLSTVLPIVLVVFLTVLITSVLAAVLADSPGPFSPFGRRVASAASHAWDNRHHLGFLSGRNINELGPLIPVLDALSASVKKWETNDNSGSNFDDASHHAESSHHEPQYVPYHGNPHFQHQVRFEK